VTETPDVQHECPMCGESMRLKRHTRVRHIPGLPEARTIEIVEWECPECDYFEEYVPPAEAEG
jgi:predicted RNA-binding Zn-ribbon protein involved in translation (DUF1610 family)